MKQPRITFVINGNSYSMAADDSASIREIPSQDRRHLIKLLEAIRYQDSLSLAQPFGSQDRSKISPVPSSTARAISNLTSSSDASSSRMGSGDIDAMMARLIVEEKRSRKQGFTKSGIYKVTAGILLVVFLLVIIL